MYGSNSESSFFSRSGSIVSKRRFSPPPLRDPEPHPDYRVAQRECESVADFERPFVLRLLRAPLQRLVQLVQRVVVAFTVGGMKVGAIGLSRRWNRLWKSLR